MALEELEQRTGLARIKNEVRAQQLHPRLGITD